MGFFMVRAYMELFLMKNLTYLLLYRVGRANIQMPVLNNWATLKEKKRKQKY